MEILTAIVVVAFMISVVVLFKRLFRWLFGMPSKAITAAVKIAIRAERKECK